MIATTLTPRSQAHRNPGAAGSVRVAVRLDRPFRGSAAVAVGLVTPNELRGPRLRRLFPDVHVLAGTEPDLALRSRAAYVHVEGNGAVVGHSAAEESRMRVAIVRYGLPTPELQFPVGPYLLDLACPQVRLAVEYDGADHRTPERAVRDLRREAYLTREGWWVLRLPAWVVHDPRETAVRVWRELLRRGLRLPNVAPSW